MRRCRTAVEMLRGRLDRRHITVEEHFGELPLVAGSAAQLNQVFLNLLVNAMQAIESTHREDGRIAITTAANNGEIVVEVADNGCGIADEVLPQIFDPFFTTKDVGDGTGLGLSITHSIVQDHGGRLEVESELGAGHPLPRFPAGGTEPGHEFIAIRKDEMRRSRPGAKGFHWILVLAIVTERVPGQEARPAAGGGRQRTPGAAICHSRICWHTWNLMDLTPMPTPGGRRRLTSS